MTKNGVPFLHGTELATSYVGLKPQFEDVTFYLTAAQRYVGSFMALGWASTDTAIHQVPLETVEVRFAEAVIVTWYYAIYP